MGNFIYTAIIADTAPQPLQNTLSSTKDAEFFRYKRYALRRYRIQSFVMGAHNG
jgi:hypothetical protein